MSERTPEHSINEQDAQHQYPPQKDQGQEEILRQRQTQYDLLRELIDTPPPGAIVRYFGDAVVNDNMLRPHQRRKITYYEISGSADIGEQRPSEVTNNGEMLVSVTQFPAEPSEFVNANQAISINFLPHPNNPSGVRPSERSGLLFPNGSIDVGQFPYKVTDDFEQGDEVIRQHKHLKSAETTTVSRVNFFTKAIQTGHAKPFNPPAGK